MRQKLFGADFWIVNVLQSQKLSLTMENNGQCVCWLVISADAALHKLTPKRGELIMPSLSKTSLLVFGKEWCQSGKFPPAFYGQFFMPGDRHQFQNQRKIKPGCWEKGRHKSQNLGSKN